MKLSKAQQTLLVIPGGMLVLFFVFKWKGFLFIGTGIILTGFIIPALGEKIHQGWMKLAHLLGYINSRILLTFIFLFILTPVSFFNKLFGKSSLQRRQGNNNSMYVIRQHRYQKKDLENTW